MPSTVKKWCATWKSDTPKPKANWKAKAAKVATPAKKKKATDDGDYSVMEQA